MTHKFKGSSSIVSCDHDGKHMTITFQSGHTYKYKDVPISMFEKFKSAESPGKFFHGQINKIFEHSKVEEDE